MHKAVFKFDCYQLWQHKVSVELVMWLGMLCQARPCSLCVVVCLLLGYGGTDKAHTSMIVALAVLCSGY